MTVEPTGRRENPTLQVEARRELVRPAPDFIPVNCADRPLTVMYRGQHYRLRVWFGATPYRDRDGHQWMAVEDFLRNSWDPIA